MDHSLVKFGMEMDHKLTCLKYSHRFFMLKITNMAMIWKWGYAPNFQIVVI